MKHYTYEEHHTFCVESGIYNSTIWYEVVRLGWLPEGIFHNPDQAFDPKRKEWDKKYYSTPEYKARKKENSSTPEYKTKRKEYNKKYTSTPEYKAWLKKYRSTPEYKASRKEIDRKYNRYRRNKK